MRAVDVILPHLLPHQQLVAAEGPAAPCRRDVLLVTAITLHNFLEGSAIGVAFSAAVYGHVGATVASAVAPAIGIGLQN